MQLRCDMFYKMPLSGKFVAYGLILLWAVFMIVAIQMQEYNAVFNTPVVVDPVQTEILIDSFNAVTPVKSNDVIRNFNEQRYTLDSLIIPRIVTTHLPYDLKTLSITDKKDLFIKIVLPLILQENEYIIKERRLALKNIHRGTEPSTAIMNALNAKYKIKTADDAELLTRIMPVPVSLALAQTAIETGWGTSYFAVNGNALFGQHAYKGQKSLTPRIPSSYKVAAFSSLSVSVMEYMNNLNTHLAYKGFRTARLDATQWGGITMSTHLSSYSELGEVYINKIKKVIQYNKFGRFDAYILDNAS